MHIWSALQIALGTYIKTNCQKRKQAWLKIWPWCYLQLLTWYKTKKCFCLIRVFQGWNSVFRVDYREEKEFSWVWFAAPCPWRLMGRYLRAWKRSFNPDAEPRKQLGRMEMVSQLPTPKESTNRVLFINPVNENAVRVLSCYQVNFMLYFM